MGGRRKWPACDTWGICLLALMVLAGCREPADQALATGGTQPQFDASLQAIYPKLAAQEQEAFQWAVGEYDLAGLHRDYPNATPRQIVHGQAQAALKKLAAQIQSLKQAQGQQDDLRNDLRQVQAVDPTFAIEPSDFGQQPLVRATVHNGSSRDISRARWVVSLYLEQQPKPAMETTIVDDYRRRGGLASGASLMTEIPLGMEFGDNAWKSQKIRQARQYRVVLELVPESVMDEGDRPYMAANPTEKLAQLSALQKRLRAYTVL